MADYTLSAKINGDSSGFTKAFSGAANVAKNFSGMISGVSDKIASIGAKTTMLGAGLTAGVTMPFLAAVKSTATFEDSMNKVRVTLLGGQKETSAFRDQFSGLQDDALDLAAKFPVDAQEVADSMLELAKSGQSTNDIMDMMPGILSAASASGEDVATTSNTVSAALAGFGLKASDAAKVADVLTNSANASKAGVADMGEVFKYAAPIAHTLGISMEELSSASGLMMDKGLEASQVGTTLTMALTRMAKPTKEAQTLMNKLGFSAVDSKGNFKGLATIVGELNTKMKNYTPAQKTAALATIMGTEAGSKFLMLMDSGADKIKANTKAISERGTAEKTAAEMQKSLSANIETMQGSADALTKSIMSQDTPALTKLTQVVTGLLDKFNELPDGIKSNIAMAFALAAAIGPVLTTIGPLITGLGGVGKILAFIVSPVGLVITALAALGAAFIYEMNTNAKFAATVKQLASNVMSAFGTIKDAIADLASGNNAGATNLLSNLIPANAAQVVVGTITTIQGYVSSFIGFMQSSFATLGPKIGPAIQAGFATAQNVIQALIPVVQTVWTAVSGFVTSFISGFTGASSSIVPAVGTIISIISALSSPFGLVMGIIKLFGPQLASLATTIMSSLTPVLSNLGGTLGSMAGTILPTLAGAFASLMPAVLAVGQTIASAVSAVLPVVINLTNQLLPIITQIVSVLAQIISGVAPIIASLVTQLMPVITSIIQTVINIVTAVAPALIAIIQTIITIIQAMLPIIMSIISVVVNVVSNVIAVVGTILTFIGNLIASIMSVISPIIAFVAGIISSIIASITPIIATVSGVFSTVYSVISGVFQHILALGRTIFTAIGGVVSGFSGVVGSVFNAVSSIVSRVMGGVSSTVTGVFHAIQGAWSGLTGFVSGVFGGVASAVETLVGQVKGFVNGVIGGINGAIGLINKIPGVSIGKIPYLARGTDNFGGGFARMNEGGRGEIALLPGGTQVIPHDVSMRAAREQGRVTAQMANTTPSVVVSNQGSDQRVVDLLTQLLDKNATVIMDGEPVGRLVDRRLGNTADDDERWNR